MSAQNPPIDVEFVGFTQDCVGRALLESKHRASHLDRSGTLRTCVHGTPSATAREHSFRQQHVVDDVDHAIVAEDVGFCDFGVIHHYRATVIPNGEELAV